MNLSTKNPFHPTTWCAIFSWFNLKTTDIVDLLIWYLGIKALDSRDFSELSEPRTPYSKNLSVIVKRRTLVLFYFWSHFSIFTFWLTFDKYFSISIGWTFWFLSRALKSEKFYFQPLSKVYEINWNVKSIFRHLNSDRTIDTRIGY